MGDRGVNLHVISLSSVQDMEYAVQNRIEVIY